jgi:hypothetical protein
MFNNIIGKCSSLLWFLKFCVRVVSKFWYAYKYYRRLSSTLKRSYVRTIPHSVTTRKTNIGTFTAVRTSDFLHTPPRWWTNVRHLFILETFIFKETKWSTAGVRRPKGLILSI